MLKVNLQGRRCVYDEDGNEKIIAYGNEEHEEKLDTRIFNDLSNRTNGISNMGDKNEKYSQATGAKYLLQKKMKKFFVKS